MFLRAEHIPQASHIEADICVIGAGAAGIAFAREFLSSDVRLCILESGDLMTRGKQAAVDAGRFLRRHLISNMHPDPMKTLTQAIAERIVRDPLCSLECTDLPLAAGTRRRAFGGSTIAWSGRWMRHDRIDFETRPWVPNSGWPFSRDELDPYYTRASESLRVPDAPGHTVQQDVFPDSALETVALPVQDRCLWNWGITFRKEFHRSSNVMACLGAHVISLAARSDHIGSVRARTATGSTFEVHAGYFVLACGGIENARLLLLSHLGNEHDQLGRYYMNHPKGCAGLVHLRISLNQSLGKSGSEGRSLLQGIRLADEIQAREGILNSQIFLEPVDSPTPLKRILMKCHGGRAINSLIVVNCLEQLPVATNRVSLAHARDPLGLPRASVSWSLSNLDKKTMVVFHRYLHEALVKRGIGTLQNPVRDVDLSAFPIRGDAFHHMGTTRMGIDPRFSVVDGDCRLHSVDNLFVAGSSVFPTGGHANPTATICALAIRLADHIKRMLLDIHKVETVALRTVA